MKHPFMGGPLQGQALEGDGPRVVSIPGYTKGRYVRKFMDSKFGVAVYVWHHIKERKSGNSV